MNEIEENVLIDTLIFNEGLEINCSNILSMFESFHEQNCCEDHYLDFDDFEKSFEAITQRGYSKIEKIEIYGTPGMGVTLFFYETKDEEVERVGIFIPGRASNNGFYSDDLTLIVTLPNGFKKEYDITSYQKEE